VRSSEWSRTSVTRGWTCLRDPTYTYRSRKIRS
jgi:hypothetical protein